MRKVALIVAAGTGSRMKSDVPKQFLLINNKPLLFYTIDAFLKSYDDLKVILVLPPEHIAKGQEIIDGFFDKSRITICPGGATRFHSVKNGLGLIKGEQIIFVHDGVRCLITTSLIRTCYERAIEYSTAIPAVECKDSLRIIKKNENKSISRDVVRLIQTPQTFHSKILIPAYKIDHKSQFTDDAGVVEAYGVKVHLVEGEEFNFKITTPLDLKLAEYIIEQRSK
ncbi:MAG: 2-C-methyl-D-erythritol 4-phosphate cytidylyltransferase [Ginsengibacter sp.]